MYNRGCEDVKKGRSSPHFIVWIHRERSGEDHCLNCGRYFNDLTNSVLAFVREVQEIGEKIEEGTILKDLIEIHKIRGKGAYEGIDEFENVKEHRFVNLSKEYAKDDVHVNIHRSVPDGLGDERYTLNQSLFALSVAFSSRFAFRIKYSSLMAYQA